MGDVVSPHGVRPVQGDGAGGGTVRVWLGAIGVVAVSVLWSGVLVGVVFGVEVLSRFVPVEGWSWGDIVAVSMSRM